MMKKLLTSLFALAVMATASAQMTDGAKARVYAYGLTQSGDDVVTVSFKTNTKANTALVTLSAEGQENIEVEASSTDGVNWTAEITPSQKFAADVAYNWSVEVSADAVTEWNELAGTPTYGTGDNDNGPFRFYRSYGICVNQNPESDYFGNVYAPHTFVLSTLVANYRPTGLYVYNPDLTLQNNGNPYVNSIFGTGEATVASSSQADMCIAEDGRLFFTATDASIFNVYAIDPSDLTKATKVFNNATVQEYEFVYSETKTYTWNELYASDGSTRITGLRGTIGVYGEGENTTIMTLEPKDMYLKLWTSPINEFNIGTGNTWDAAPTNVIGDTESKMKQYQDETKEKTYSIYFANGNNYSTLEATNSGFWGVQYYSSPTNNVPTIFYYSRITGMVEYRDVSTNPSNSSSTALAVNDDLGLVAYAGVGSSSGTPAVVTKYTEDEEGAITVTNEPNSTDYVMTVLGKKADAMAFDYAGNLYAITSGNETMAVYALPDALVGENTRVTPAKKSLTIAYTQGQIEATGVETIGVDNAPVEYYNLQGVKVENPENGIFIKKQGNKAVKVIL